MARTTSTSTSTTTSTSTSRPGDGADLGAATVAVLGEGVRLREEQERALAALERTDTLLVARSGLGKTAVYDIASRLRPGLAVVVSPTLSLQRDQVATLHATGRRAALLNSTLGAAAERETLDRVAGGATDVLLLAPEQLGRDAVVSALAHAEVGLVVVDEAHCVSEWGHDFRPDYLQVGAAVRRLGHPRVLAMTATASQQVRDDVLERLGLDGAEVVVGDVDRPNIHLAAQDVPDARRAERAVLDAVAARTGAAVVYAQTRADVERLVGALRGEGVPAEGYHAGMPARRREQVQDDFVEGRSEVVVATSAFGMGIDRADVRLVVHAGPPPSLDAYYQEVGRAGRDGERAWALLVHRAEDFALGRYLRSSGGPRPATLRAVLRALRDGPATRAELTGRTGLAARTVSGAVGALVQAGAVGEDADGRLSRAQGEEADAAVLRRVAEERERRRTTDRTRVELVRAYADSRDCRRRMLLELLGEEHPRPCGRCDGCDAGRASEVGTTGFHVGQRVRHRELGDGVVQVVEPDRITVLFDGHGFTALALGVIEQDDGLLRAA